MCPLPKLLSGWRAFWMILRMGIDGPAQIRRPHLPDSVRDSRLGHHGPEQQSEHFPGGHWTALVPARHGSCLTPSRPWVQSNSHGAVDRPSSAASRAPCPVAP